MRNGGQVLVESLVALGAKKAFGVPGESYLAVLDAMHDSQGAFDFVLCRNEGGASFMAAAWGNLSGDARSWDNQWFHWYSYSDAGFFADAGFRGAGRHGYERS